MVRSLVVMLFFAVAVLLGVIPPRESHFSPTGVLALPDTGADRAQGLAHARQAQAQVKAEAYAAAVASYGRARQHLPQIADWLHLFAASAAASAGDTMTVAAELANADSAVRADWGWRAEVRARQTAGNARSALAIAEAIAAGHPAAGIRAEASARAGELRLQLEDVIGARQAFQRALQTAPSSPHALTAARALAGLPRSSGTERKLIADIQLRHGDLDAALASYAAYLGTGSVPDAEQIGILEATGRALFDRGRYDDAEKRLLAVAARSASPETAAGALFMAARARYRDGRRTAAVATLERVIERFPRTEAAAEAAWLLGDLAHDRGARQQARSHYRTATVLAPTSDPAGAARMRLAGMHFASRDYAAALHENQAYLAAFPDGRRAQQARYWAALASEQLGRREDAASLLREVRTADPLSYYGVRAAERLGDGFWNVPMNPSPAHDESRDPLVAHALVRLELLRELGWDDAADFELRAARRQLSPSDGSLYTLADGLIAHGFTSSGIALGWELYRREAGWNLRLLRIIYPFPYRQLVLAEAADRNIDPFLAAGLIRQESTFDPRAVSRAGAVGLMQVMPATARALARRLGIRDFRTAQLTRPDVNLRLGMAFLADQLRTWNGRIVPVLTAYNAGPTRMQQWRSLPEFGRDELFTERIPYQETRDYVKAVRRNAAIYRALYGNVVTEQAGN